MRDAGMDNPLVWGSNHSQGDQRMRAGQVTRGLRAGDFGVGPAGFTKGFGENPAIPCLNDQVTHKPLVGSSNLPLATLPDSDVTDRWPLAEPEDRGLQALSRSSSKLSWMELPLSSRDKGFWLR